MVFKLQSGKFYIATDADIDSNGIRPENNYMYRYMYVLPVGDIMNSATPYIGRF